MPSDLEPQNAALALIRFLRDAAPEDPAAVMRLWCQGDMPAIRAGWPECPEAALTGPISALSDLEADRARETYLSWPLSWQIDGVGMCLPFASRAFHDLSSSAWRKETHLTAKFFASLAQEIIQTLPPVEAAGQPHAVALLTLTRDMCLGLSSAANSSEDTRAQGSDQEGFTLHSQLLTQFCQRGMPLVMEKINEQARLRLEDVASLRLRETSQRG